MALLSDLFDQNGKPMENDPLAIARALAGMKPQTQGTAFEPVTPQQQLSNYRQLEGQQQAWQTAEGSPWKPAEPGPMAKMIGNALTSQTGQRFMDLANFLGPGPKAIPRPVMAPEGPKGVRAYHGSPHDFDKFDLSRIGTGEGAQAYGHGLYFAEKEAVAKGYRDALQASKYHANDAPVPDELQAAAYRLKVNNGDPEAALKTWLNDTYGETPGSPSIATEEQAMRKQLAELSGRDISLKPTGRLYEVNIKADPETLLDWDKPLSQQPPQVRALIESNPKAAKALAFQSEFLKQEPTGKAAYRAFASGPEADPKSGVSASAALREAGIPGIRYKDAGSRGAEGGTNNYVVFDDALVEIVRKYGIAGLMAAMGLTASGDAEAGKK